MLTSLMQKSDDNSTSRAGFELAKQLIKLHLAHQRLENNLDNYNQSDGVKIENCVESVMMERESQMLHPNDNCCHSSLQRA